jgi:uncharacterized protein (DUF1501 family)
MKRRNFLKALPIGAAATAIPFMLGSRRAEALMHSPMLTALTNPTADNDRILVVLFLEGGNDGLNTLIPFEDPLYDKYRADVGFTTAAEKAQITFKVRDDLGFNPACNSLEPLWQEGKMAIVQNIGIENPDLSHFRGLEMWNSASDFDQVISTGWAGRYLETIYPDYPTILPLDPIAINMGTLGSQIFRGTHSMMDVQVPDPLTFAPAAFGSTDPLPNTCGGKELGFVRDLVNISNVYANRFTELFPTHAQSTVEYPDYQFARDLQHVAWCIAAGMKTKIYFVNLIGFDTHFVQLSKDPSQPGHGYLLKILSESVYAFQRDLEGLGVADRVLTMTYSEFGRRIHENGGPGSGTEHGTTAPHFIFGTSVNGELYGHHPDLVHLDKNGDAINEFEFRKYYSAVLGDWFGLDRILRTSILSPGAAHDPWDITFPVNGKINKLHLISQSRSQRDHSGGRPSFQSSVSPNPANGQTVLSFWTPTQAAATISIFDAQGRNMNSVQQQCSFGYQEYPIQTQALSSGLYYVHLKIGNDAETIKLMVKH